MTVAKKTGSYHRDDADERGSEKTLPVASTLLLSGPRLIATGSGSSTTAKPAGHRVLTVQISKPVPSRLGKNEARPANSQKEGENIAFVCLVGLDEFVAACAVGAC